MVNIKKLQEAHNKRKKMREKRAKKAGLSFGKIQSFYGEGEKDLASFKGEPKVRKI